MGNHAWSPENSTSSKRLSPPTFPSRGRLVGAAICRPKHILLYLRELSDSFRNILIGRDIVAHYPWIFNKVSFDNSQNFEEMSDTR